MTDCGDSADGIAREGVTIICDGGGGNIPHCNNSKELRASYLPHDVLELRESNGQYGIYGGHSLQYAIAELPAFCVSSSGGQYRI